MKKKNLNLKKLSLQKNVITDLNLKLAVGGGATEITCGENTCLTSCQPTFQYSCPTIPDKNGFCCSVLTQTLPPNCP